MHPNTCAVVKVDIAYLVPNQLDQKILEKKMLQILKRNRLNRSKLRLKLKKTLPKNDFNVNNTFYDHDYTNALSALLVILLWLLIIVAGLLIYISGLDLSSIGPKNQVLLTNKDTFIKLTLSVISSSLTTGIATNNGSAWYILLYNLLESLIFE